MKFHRTYPLWLHSLHLVYHGSLLVTQIVGFAKSFQSSSSESLGPGWRFRYCTSWIISVLVLYVLAAFVFDILLILKGIDDSVIKTLRIHFDRFFCLMFSTSIGLGFFFHLLFFISCAKDKQCPPYTDGLWALHLMLFWYALAEYFLVPHNTKRDIKTTPILVFVFCLIYFINYWLFVAQTHGRHPYGDPWPVWQWFAYSTFPLAVLVLRLLDIVRDRLYYKRGLRSPCIHPTRTLRTNPCLGWHINYPQTNDCEAEPIDWKAIGAMSAILLLLVAIWNISYLITAR